MPELTLRFQVAEGRLLHRQLARMSLDLDDFREPLEEAGGAYYDAIKGEFARQGQYGPQKWPALSEWYARWKATHHPGKTMLRLTDALYRSITDKGDAHAIYELSSHTLRLGTSLETPTGGWNLGLIHQLGAPRARWGPIPARPIIRNSKGTRTRITVIFTRWLQRKAAEADLAMST
jgi:hypothetical protein